LDVLREARAEGRCRYIGITANDSDKLAQVLRRVDVDTCLSAFGFDMLRRGTRRDVMPVARKAGVAMILGGVLSGLHDTAVHPEWLTTPPPWMTPELRVGFERLYRVQSQCGLSLIEMTLRYLIADRDVSTVVVGAARPAEIEESVEAAANGPLPAEIHDSIEALGTHV
jgi:D-threo-aldose 1-dehydrogenase